MKNRRLGGSLHDPKPGNRFASLARTHAVLIGGSLWGFTSGRASVSAAVARYVLLDFHRGIYGLVLVFLDFYRILSDLLLVLLDFSRMIYEWYGL